MKTKDVYIENKNQSDNIRVTMMELIVTADDMI